MGHNGSKRPVETPSQWEQMHPSEFQAAGLLYYVNSTVLWPLGLALYVVRDEDSGSFTTEMGVMRLKKPEIIVDNDPDGPNHPRYDATKWIATRIQSMNDVEKADAVALMDDPMNVASFLAGLDNKADF